MIEALIAICVGLAALFFFAILPIAIAVAGVVGTIRFFMGGKND